MKCNIKSDAYNMKYYKNYNIFNINDIKTITLEKYSIFYSYPSNTKLIYKFSMKDYIMCRFNYFLCGEALFINHQPDF